jgi:hypothetical protein
MKNIGLETIRVPGSDVYNVQLAPFQRFAEKSELSLFVTML